MECKVTARKSHYPKDVPFEVPEGWVWSTLGEVFNLQAGRYVSANDIHTESTLYQYRCFGGNGIRGYVSNFNRKGDYPIIGRQGALCGNINYASGEFYATEHAVVVESFAGTDSIWAKYLLEQLNLNQYATATAQPGLSVKTINEVAIPIPPVGEQRRISDAITRCLGMIDGIQLSYEGLIASIDQTKSRVLDLAIHGKLVPQDSLEEPAINILRRINPNFQASDNLHYEDGVKNGWLRCRVSDAFEINPKVTGNDEDECAFVPMALIPAGYSNRLRFERKKWATIKTGFTRFADGDIGVAKISPCLENRKSVIFNGLPSGIGAGTTELIIFRPILVVAEYGLLFFKSREFVSNCKGTYNGVVGQQRVDISVIRRMYIDIPPIPEQLKIVKTVKLLFRHLDSLQCSDALKL